MIDLNQEKLQDMMRDEKEESALRNDYDYFIEKMIISTNIESEINAALKMAKQYGHDISAKELLTDMELI